MFLVNFIVSPSITGICQNSGPYSALPFSMRTIRPIRPTAASISRTIASVTKCNFAHLVRCIHHGLLVGGDLARNGDIAWRNIHYWIIGEEVPRTQKQCHRLDRHYREIFRRWDMRHTECVPQHYVGILDGLFAVTDPLREAW